MADEPKHPGGRPTIYCDEIVEKSKNYLENYKDEGDVIPSAIGLALYLDICRDTLYDWSGQEGKEEFSYIFKKINSKQHQVLMNGGLKGELNAAITKLALGKHGYHDKVDTDVTSKGKKVSNNFIIQPVITKTDG